MTQKELKKSMAIFPIGTIMQVTGLSARQIRYYEAYRLITPKRSESNRRLYSLNDIDRLLEIIDKVEEGMTLKGIQKYYAASDTQAPQPSIAPSTVSRPLTDQDVRRILLEELDIHNRF